MTFNFTILCKRRSVFFAMTLVLFSFMGKAQNADQYGFTATTGTFTSILGQTGVGTIPTIHGDDQTSNGNVPFQFTFDYCGHSYTGFRVCSNGWVSFNSSLSIATSSNSLTNLAVIKPALMPLWDNLTGVSALNATALFMTTGTAPNRVFTYECNNWGWNNMATTPVISFQIKLYETSNIIEFIYRQDPGSVSTPASATIGIGDGNTTPTFLVLDNSSASPTASSTTFTTTISTRPATGQIYRFTPPPPCSGAPPAATVSPAGPINICVAAPVNLSGLLTPPASGVSYQWEESATGAAPWTAVANATNSNVTFNPVASNYYRLITTCTATGQTNTSNVIQVNVAPPVYAAIPYSQDFETWTSYCDNSDIPQGSSTNWRNTPATGDASWRREDQGATANWSSSFGGYFPASWSGLHSASFSSSSVSNMSSGNVSGDMDLYLDCSSVAGGKALYLYYINPSFGFGSGDSLRVYLSTDGGGTFSQIGVFDTADNWKQVSLPIQSNSSQTLVRLSGYVSAALDFTDIGVDSLYIALPCTGAPTAGVITNTGTLCAGGSYTFTPSGTSMAGSLSFIWEQSVNGITWTPLPGATTQTYTTPALYDTTLYRMIVICTGSGLSDTTNVITLDIASPQYAATPFTESFENWMNNCGVSDVPSLNWVNSPSTGDNSWRREDQGSTAWSFLGGDYSPVAKHLNHSARFHSWNTTSTGNLELFVDCSGTAGGKEIQFYYINPSSFQDSLRVSISTDGGVTFNPFASYAGEMNWALKAIPFISVSTQTIIRFQGLGDWSDDIGIDYVRVLDPCTGMPVAGTVDSVKVCAGQNFDLSLTGTSAAAGLTYQWQSSPDNITWTNVINGNTPIVTTTVTAPTYFRAIVTCSNTGLSDTSPSQFFDIAPFYLCYCANVAQSFSPEDIGNVTVRRISPLQTVLNNGTASPLTNNTASVNGYTDYTGVTPPSLHQGAAYNFRMTAITQDIFFWGGSVAFYIDLDRDGVFNPASEKVVGGTVSSGSQQFNGNFTIPTTSQMGITGMRVVMESLFGNPDPCNPPLAGEVEDYLVNIDFPICTGPVNAGNAILIDTSVCVNEPFMAIDTNHEKQLSSIAWIWQSSPDNITWTDITGTDQQDTLLLNAPMTNTYYRLRVTCTSSGDVTYSSEALLKIRPAYFCYCESYADGGGADLSDLGAFSIGTFVVNSGGPHLSNPGAINHYTANDNIVKLYLDSAYSVNAYHVIKDANQQDAKVTLFIDYDNNFIYDIPSERVWTGFTNASNVFINSTVTIPAGAVKNVFTGMRLILNNDTNPNTPSDEACGTYTSGETEDYVVILLDKNDPPASVPDLGNEMYMEIFPNPSTGVFNLKFVSFQPQRNLKVRITDITGKEINSSHYSLAGKELVTQIDLSHYAKGVYMVQVVSDSKTIIKKLVIK